jgi:hypothetical protein
MKNLIIVFSISTFAVWLPSLIWVSVDTYLFNHPDMKFGASGGVLFAAALVGLEALIAGASSALVQLLAMIFKKYRIKKVRLVALLGGLSLSGLSPVIAIIPPIATVFLDEVAGIALSWSILCLVVMVAWHFIVYWAEHNKAIQRSSFSRR